MGFLELFFRQLDALVKKSKQHKKICLRKGFLSQICLEEEFRLDNLKESLLALILMS